MKFLRYGLLLSMAAGLCFCQTYRTPATALGETNTASNVGTAGTGLFDLKSGRDLQFRKLNAGSNKITITLDAGNRKVDIDIAQSNLVLAISQITGLQTALDGKAASSHSHAASDVTSGALAAARGGLGVDASALSGVVKMQSGLASTVSGSGTDCVKVDGSSGTCGGGGSPDMPTVSVSGTTYTLLSSDLGKTVQVCNSSPVAVTIPSVGSISATDGKMVRLQNICAGLVTATAASGVDLNNTMAGSTTVERGESILLRSDGSGWWTTESPRLSVGSGIQGSVNTATGRTTLSIGSHVHSAADTTTGQLAAARGGLGVDASAFAGVVAMSGGTASTVAGSATDCVKVNGTSGACGGGSAETVIIETTWCVPSSTRPIPWATNSDAGMAETYADMPSFNHRCGLTTATGPSNNNYAGWTMQTPQVSIANIPSGKTGLFEWQLKSDSVTTGKVFARSDWWASTTPPLDDTADGFGFRRLDGANWFAQMCASSSCTNVDTGVAYSANTYYRFTLAIPASGDQTWTVYTATATTAFASAATGTISGTKPSVVLRPNVAARNVGGTVIGFTMLYFKYSQQ